LLFTGTDERQLQEQVASQMRYPPIVVQGQSLRQAAALLAACDLYIGNDTGPMHIAAAVETTVIAIFGSTNHRRSGPYGRRHIVVQSGLELGCNPCHPGGRPGGCGAGTCAVIEAITVEQVLGAAGKILSVEAR
jgi:ADP-heptose:LPS heptosyltransferase